ncbi:hypothetical protein E5676_scaffold2510G00670 [Cucumis melo var. makuwa]|uniref:Uncharacterized protein n=1 Tax=Cucumis melo var. makuwa TaxID=1194695 RepID=A0A5D3BMF9_CUCMM|nr:hypothetical protein E5676_scaffold2510G00670 [Cucumis melo var. makuwa]
MARSEMGTNTDGEVVAVYALINNKNQYLAFLCQEQNPPQWYNSTVPFEYTMLLHCILTNQVFNLGQIMQGSFLTWMEHRRGAKPFPSIVEKLCLHLCIEEARIAHEYESRSLIYLNWVNSS